MRNLVICALLMFSGGAFAHTTPPQPARRASAILVVAPPGVAGSYRAVARNSQRRYTGHFNRPIRVRPGNYRVVVNGNQRMVRVRRGRVTRVAVGAILVRSPGSARAVFGVYSGSRRIASRRTGGSVAVFHGTYRIRLNGTWTTLHVMPRRTAVAIAGVIIVRGPRNLGGDFVLSRANGRRIATVRSGRVIAVFAGAYRVSINGSSTLLRVIPGRASTARAGAVVVRAPRGVAGRYAVVRNGRRISDRRMGRIVVLFAGNYRLVVNGTTQAINVFPGRVSSAWTGALMVRGQRRGGYVIQNARTNRVVARGARRGRPVALFAGTYRVVVRGRRRMVRVRPGRIATVAFPPRVQVRM